MPTEFVAAAGIGGGTLNQNDYFTINGVAITGFEVVSDDATDTLVRAINAQSVSTGVTAAMNVDGELTLNAEDGRNIDIELLGNASAITGIAASTVQTASQLV